MVAEFCLYGNRTILFKRFVSASFLHVLLLSLCHPAIVLVLFVVRRSFVLSFSLHIRPCSLLPLLPLFFACCCCFFCASPFSFCFPFLSLLFVRALCLFFYCFLLYCSTNTERLLYVQQLHERQGHNQDLQRRNQGRRSGGQGLGNPPPPPLLLQAAVDRHRRQHPRLKKKTQGARNHPRARVGQAVRDRPGHL